MAKKTKPTEPVTISLDSEYQEIQSLTPVASKTIEFDISRITSEQRKKAKELVKTLDPKDANSVHNFGVSLQQEIGDFSQSLISKVKTVDAGEAGDIIQELLANINHVDLTLEKNWAERLPIIGNMVMKLTKKVENAISNYQDIAKNLDSVITKLDSARVSLSKDVTMLQQLRDKNIEYIKSMENYIVAIKMKIEEIETDIQENKGQFEEYELTELYNYKERLDKKAHDMMLSRYMAIQTASQIPIISTSNNILIEKIQSSVLNTIPLWKNQISIALALDKQAKVIQIQQTVDDTTNALVTKNATKLRLSAVEAAKANQRGIVSIDALRKANQEFMATLDDVQRIQIEGKKQRQDAEKELVKLESELKNKILEVSKNQVQERIS